MRVKICKSRHKTEAQFYEHNCILGEAKWTHGTSEARPLGRAVKPEVDQSLPQVRGHTVPTEPVSWPGW
jgi:hypothetical protein